jgi:hypothetical protein
MAMLRKILTSIWLGWILSNNPQGYCEDRFSLPANKTPMVLCQENALSLHPGTITSESRVHTKSGNVEIHLEIDDRTKNHWLVDCDGLTGKILKQINLDE